MAGKQTTRSDKTVRSVAEPSTYLYNMSALIPAGTSSTDPLTEIREIGYDGLVTKISVVSVAGAQQTVGAQFGFQSGERVFPRDDPQDAQYVPLAGERIENEPNVYVDEGEEVQFRFVNNDPNEDHFVTALIHVKEGL